MNIKTEYVNTPDGNTPIHRSTYANKPQGNCNASVPTEFISTFHDQPQGSNEKTRVHPSPEAETHRPNTICVGWVVAINGPMQGKSFDIFLGQNHLGSESRNDIVITKAQDPGISGYNHVNIEYDQKLNKYYISRGNEGHSLAYLNGDRLSGGQECELKRGDVIELSELTILRFVPFCDEQFNWTKVKSGEEK